MSASSHPSAVVVHVNFACPETATARVTSASEPASVQGAAPNPHAVRRAFAEWWQTYVHDHYTSIAQVQWVFQVSERCARKWWNGETGCNGAQLAVAYRRHPDVVGPLMMGMAA